jgi:hypothetical protein
MKLAQEAAPLSQEEQRTAAVGSGVPLDAPASLSLSL